MRVLGVQSSERGGLARVAVGGRRAPRSRSAPPARRAREGAPSRPSGPPVDDDITGAELDRAVRTQLESLSAGAGARVARHLAMAGRVLEHDPEAALEHAQAARAVPGASRVAAVREAVGLAAYAAGRYDLALPELRAARRISGSPDLLPVIADSERGVGHPERALQLATDPQAAQLPPEGRAELLVVSAGAHRDRGRLDAALAVLRVPALDRSGDLPWVARLRYAYADALLAAGDREAARHWFARAGAADAAGETDAAERLAELEGVVLVEEEPPPDTGA